MAGSALHMETQPEFERESDMGRPVFRETDPDSLFSRVCFYTLRCYTKVMGMDSAGNRRSERRRPLPLANGKQAFTLPHLTPFARKLDRIDAANHLARKIIDADPHQTGNTEAEPDMTLGNEHTARQSKLVFG